MKVFKNIILDGQNGKPILTDIFFQDTRVAKPVIIYAHGFNGFKDWGNFDLIAEKFAKAGFVFVKFNFSHNGTTPDHPEEFVDLEAYADNNYIKELDDLGEVIEWTLSDHEQSAHIDRKKLFLLGHSMGGGIALLKASQDRRVKAVVTWASIAECNTPWGSWSQEKMKDWKEKGVLYIQNTRTKQDLPLNYQLYESYVANKIMLDIGKAIKRLKIPILICHGTKDTSVPVEKAHLLHEQQSKSELLLVNSDHVFGRMHPWADQTLPKPMEKVLNRTIEFLSAV